MKAKNSERQQQLTELVEHPRENLSIELKGWMDPFDGLAKAHTARELLALANHGGGYLVFGFEEEDGNQPTPLAEPADLAPYSQDEMNSILRRYAEPRFEVEVEFVSHSDGGTTHPVVIVPSDLDIPVRAQRDGPERRHVAQHTYYTRQPGPLSAPIHSGREWDVLLERCIRAKREDLLDNMRDLIAGAPQPAAQSVSVDSRLEDFIALAQTRFEELIGAQPGEPYPEPYSHGTWHFAYRVLGAKRLSVSELRDTLQGVVGHETGWPAWWWPNVEESAPRPWEGRIECKMGGGTFKDSGHSDYWLADPEGMLFLLRGYDDDSADRGAPKEPGSLMDLTLPIWRLGECLLHAERFAAAVSAESTSAEVEIEVRWTGLKGRTLTTWASPMRRMSPHLNRGQDSVSSRVTAPAAAISEQLLELVKTLAAPLYEAFDFFEPPDAVYREELEALRGRRR